MPKKQPETMVSITLPARLWQDTAFCLGPKGVGCGSYSVEASKEANFGATIAAIDKALAEADLYDHEREREDVG